MSQIWLAIRVRLKMALSKCSVWGQETTAGFNKQVQGYSYDQRLENVDIAFNVPHTPIVGLGQ